MSDKWKNRIVGEDIVKAGSLLASDRNWRIHPKYQQDALEGIISDVGWVQRVIVNKRTSSEWGNKQGVETVVDGHLRVSLAISRGEETEVPVVFVDLSPKEEALILSTFDPISALAIADNEMLAQLLAETESENEAVKSLLDELNKQDVAHNPPPRSDPAGRQLPLDMIFTFSGEHAVPCCMAVQAGFKYGAQSGRQICDRESHLSGRHKLCFLDNQYFTYDHATHVMYAQKYHPKYVTTRDILGKQQCTEMGITYYSFQQILSWAEEFEQHVENVIVIPKYDCLDKIPEKYILGYSIPTSHGGTPLPIEAFKGRRVHLLGGSWRSQLDYLAILGDDVVSVDNNQIHKIAKFGNFVTPDGEEKTLDTLGITWKVTNTLYLSLALSLGSIAGKVKELYASREEPAEEEVEDAAER